MLVNYGSDKDGLICGYRFAPCAAGEVVDLEAAVAWLNRTADSEPAGFIWLHFNLAHVASEPAIKAHFDVAPEFFEARREGSRSTRIEDTQDSLFAVINDVAFEFAFDPSQIETLWVHVGPRMAISARVHPLRSIDRLRQDVKDGCRFDSSVAFLNHLMQDQADVLVRIVRDATVKVDSTEDSLLQGRLQNKRVELGRLRRVLVRLQRLLAPEPSALFRLLRAAPAWITANDLEELRQSTEEFTLVIRDLAELQERIKLLQEEIAAQLGEQTNRSLFTLTIVTVLALPINIIAGLLGMNVGGIPMADNPHGFALVVIIVVSITVLAVWFAFRKRE